MPDPEQAGHGLSHGAAGLGRSWPGGEGLNGLILQPLARCPHRCSTAALRQPCARSSTRLSASNLAVCRHAHWMGLPVVHKGRERERCAREVKKDSAHAYFTRAHVEMWLRVGRKAGVAGVRAWSCQCVHAYKRTTHTCAFTQHTHAHDVHERSLLSPAVVWLSSPNSTQRAHHLWPSSHKL